VFSRRFRGSCRNPDEVHGTLMARRQFPIHFSVGTDPDKKVCQLYLDDTRVGDEESLRAAARLLMMHDCPAPVYHWIDGSTGRRVNSLCSPSSTHWIAPKGP
jgi:hypothetical protein